MLLPPHVAVTVGLVSSATRQRRLGVDAMTAAENGLRDAVRAEVAALTCEDPADAACLRGAARALREGAMALRSASIALSTHSYLIEAVAEMLTERRSP